MEESKTLAKELIEIGVFTEEEALAKCSENGSRERRMLITKPYTKKVGDEDNKVTTIVYTPEKYNAEDLIFDFLTPKNEDEDEEDSVDTVDTEETTDEDSDWLAAL